MTSLQERIAHYLTGYVCGACKCSNNLGWSKPERQPSCECYQAAGEILSMAFPPEGPEREALVDRVARALCAIQCNDDRQWKFFVQEASAALAAMIGEK